MKKLLSIVLCVAMLLGTMSFAVSAEESLQTIAVYTRADGVWGECGGPASESFEFKIYSNDTLIGTTSLNNIDGIIDGDVYVTWSLRTTPNNPNSYWTYTWEEGHPRVDYIPTKAELWIDGALYATGAVQPNGPDGINPCDWTKDVANVAYVAKIGDVKYGTVEAAIAAAQTGLMCIFSFATIIPLFFSPAYIYRPEQKIFIQCKAFRIIP